MHHPSGADALVGSGAQLSQHGLRRVATMDDHRQIQLPGQVKLGTQDSQLFVQVGLAKQVQAKFADGDNAPVILSGLTKNLRCICLPVLGIEGMNTNGIPHFWEAIRQGSDCRNFSGLDAGMH